jgi:hypothetical protein
MFLGWIARWREGRRRARQRGHYASLLHADEARLRAMGLNRSDVRLAFLRTQGKPERGPDGPAAKGPRGTDG